MTLKQRIQAQIDAHKAEISKLEADLAAGGTWLEQEIDTIESWFAAKIAALKGEPKLPPIAQ